MTSENFQSASKLPVHVAIIMDGNGRWAKAQGKERIFGHHKGVDTVKEIVEFSVKTGIEYLSLFAFSTENWNRPQTEVDALMELLVMAIEREIEDLHKNNIRLITIGDVHRLPVHCVNSIQRSTGKTSSNTGMTLCIALSYSGKWDILQAAVSMAENFTTGKLTTKDMTESTLESFLSTSEMPDPELLIRTGGETRISNFFLWQAAYAEIYFSSKLWPDFDETEFRKALDAFQKCERRFGKISEQLQK